MNGFKGVLGLALIVTTAACSKGGEIDPNSWTCQSLMQPIIDMSKDKELQVLEISDISQDPTPPGMQQIACSGRAEWSQGDGFISYGAHVSNGGSVMLEYSQK